MRNLLPASVVYYALACIPSVACTGEADFERCLASSDATKGTDSQTSTFPRAYTGSILTVSFVKYTAPTTDPDNDGGVCLKRCGFAENHRDYSFQVILHNNGHVSVRDGEPAKNRFERALTTDELNKYLELRYAASVKDLLAIRSPVDTSSACPEPNEAVARWFGAGLSTVNAQGYVVDLGVVDTCFRDSRGVPSAEQEGLMALTEWLRLLGQDVVGGCEAFGETLSDAGSPLSDPEVLNICKFEWDVESVWQ